jgi:hypothetical protein
MLRKDVKGDVDRGSVPNKVERRMEEPMPLEFWICDRFRTCGPIDLAIGNAYAGD